MGSLKLGVGRRMVPVPGALWRLAVRRSARATDARTRRLSADHRRVVDHACVEVARTDRPLPIADIAGALGLDPDRVTRLVEDLERAKTYLFRNEAGEVEWVYPITAAATPHRLKFSTGEAASAA